jgi:hypothetical protein
MLIFNVRRRKYNSIKNNYQDPILFNKLPKLVTGDEDINQEPVEFNRMITLNGKNYYLRSVIAINLDKRNFLNTNISFVTGCKTLLLEHPSNGLNNNTAKCYDPFSANIINS